MVQARSTQKGSAIPAAFFNPPTGGVVWCNEHTGTSQFTIPEMSDDPTATVVGCVSVLSSLETIGGGWRNESERTTITLGLAQPGHAACGGGRYDVEAETGNSAEVLGGSKRGSRGV